MAFTSADTTLVPGDTNGQDDVVLVDRLNGSIRRISVASDGTQSTRHSRAPAMSSDGRYTTFLSTSPVLVPDKTNMCTTIFGPDDCQDVFVHDRETGVTERVSLASDGTQADGSSGTPAISADGRFVAFPSTASNLVANDTNDCGGVSFSDASCQDIFVHDRETGVTERVSVASDGTQANRSATPLGAPISADGHYVAFHSSASNLVPGDSNGSDVFVHDRETGVTERVSVASDGAQGDQDSQQPAMTPDGRYVAFQSLSSTLAPSDTNNRFDVFVRDRGPAIGIGGITLFEGDAAVDVSGWATFSGTVLASVADPADDGGADAQGLGAELTKVASAHRTELEDVLVTLDVTRLPTSQLPLAGAVAGSPGVLYGLELRLAGVRYEIRATRVGATAAPPAAPLFALYRCDPGCVEVARLSGGFGTTGQRIEVALPLAAFGAEAGDPLTDVRGFTARGEAATGVIQPLDEVDLPSVSFDASSVVLGIAPSTTPEKDVTFQTPTALEGGGFTGTVGASGFSPGSYRVWAKACLGETCGTGSRPASL